MKTLLTSIFVLIATVLFSQGAPPTLSFGLDKVLFGKGVIDVDLLTDIIAEKQDELKARIIEQEILEPVFKNTSFATKNYVFSVVRDLLQEKDKNVLKKQVMEQTVNYAVIYAIAELFVEHSSDSTLNTILVREGQTEKQQKEQGYFTSALFRTRNWELPWINYVDVRYGRRTKMKDPVTGKFDSTKVKNEIRRNIMDSKVKPVYLNDLLMDCILQAVLSNEKLKSKGFFNKSFYFNLDQYKSMSYYHQYKDEPQTDCIYEMVETFVNNIAELYESFELLEKYISENEIESMTFDLNKFKQQTETRFQNLSLQLRRSEIGAIESQIQEITEASDNTARLKHTKSTYKLIVRNMTKNHSLKLGHPSYYFDNVNLFKDTLNWLKKEYEKDLNLIQQDTMYSKDSALLLTIYDHLVPKEKGGNTSTYFSKLKTHLSSMVVDLNEKINTISKFENLIYSDDEIDSQTEDTQRLKKEAIEALEEAKKLTDIASLKIEDLLDRLQTELNKVAKNAKLKLKNEEDSVIQTLFKSYYHLKYNKSKAINMSYIVYLTNDILPQIQTLNIKTKGRLIEVSRLVEQIAILIERDIVNSLLTKLGSMGNGKLSPQFERLFERDGNITAISFFLKFFEHLDRLDEIDTYYYLLEQLKVAGEQSANRDIANIVSMITQNIEKYSSYELGNERIDLNIEMIIDALYNRYGNRDKNPLNFHLTVGLNNAFALNNNALIGVQGDTIQNLGYASEKIGIRLNLFNFKMRHTYLSGESWPRNKNKSFVKDQRNYSKEPLISNVHLLLYGSGFLYQLADLGTTKDIQSTFVGGGFGTSFYNNLNFNVTYLLPIKYNGSTKFEHGAINLGFDIYFGEYISALNKKRKANKKAKLESQYANQNAQNKTAVKQSTIIRK